MTPEHEAEFCDFVAERSARLRQFAYICCGDWHRAEDTVQAALVKLYLNWTKPNTSVEAYTRKIIVNTLLAQRRRLWFTREHPSETLPERPQGDIAGPTGDRLTVVQVMLGLPERQRAVIALRYWDDLPVEETARILGCSPGAVKNLTMRALARMRGELSETVLAEIEGATS
ncbi:SigE family RNA polymerase sigma factor [Phytomonospora endophytica]|uniref:RNA polymerase sigma-70 factor (Sigma-E family) n=1 Tax=Phytomonospora endophytica TaxID=714109 RepID=A0A841FKF1_9ACTN|nr:SigE family RNA polymerase sigma factor [Phytomonospora endophytica]MBB6036355.1 RNA polymerase sigma-70 factor (sigma-E family) [Phytomonospora endophytica]GIG67262.1 RNA polymerase sigma24 factor [Phytomonospora endophytica]